MACVGLLLCVLLQRLYVTPILTADAPGYLSAAANGWGRYYRTPAYGYLLRFAIEMGSLGVATLVQAGTWCIMLFIIAFVAGRLLQSSVLGAAVALLFLYYDVLEMSFLPYHWHLLTESLVKDLLLLGIVGLAFALLRRSPRILFFAVFSVGVSVWLKPVPVSLFIAMPFIFAVLRPCMQDARSLRQTLFAFILLCAPVASASVYNAVHFGSFAPGTVGGLTIMSHTEALYRDGDRVFDDDATNAAFADVMRTGTYVGTDVVGFPTEHELWGAMRTFLMERISGADFGRRVYELDRESRRIFFRLFLLHPAEYARNVFAKSVSILTIDRSDDLPWRNGAEGIVARQMHLLGEMAPSLHEGLQDVARPSFSAMDFGVIRRLNAVRFLSDDILMSPTWHAFQLLLLCFACIVGFGFLRSRDHRHRCTGVLILTLLATGILHTVFTAAIVFIDNNDIRYRLPAMACFSLAVWVALAAAVERRRFFPDVLP